MKYNQAIRLLVQECNNAPSVVQTSAQNAPNVMQAAPNAASQVASRPEPKPVPPLPPGTVAVGGVKKTGQPKHDDPGCAEYAAQTRKIVQNHGYSIDNLDFAVNGKEKALCDEDEKPTKGLVAEMREVWEAIRELRERPAEGGGGVEGGGVTREEWEMGQKWMRDRIALMQAHVSAMAAKVGEVVAVGETVQGEVEEAPKEPAGEVAGVSMG